MFDQDIESFIRDYVKELRSNNAAIFAGAGLSVGAGFVDWVRLLEPLAQDLGLDSSKESHQLVALAQFYENRNGRHRINQRILEEFPAERAPTENHRLLAKLPITKFWTTNYDKLLETALSDAGKVADVKHDVQQLAHTLPRRNAVVYKMHGDDDLPVARVFAAGVSEWRRSTAGGVVDRDGIRERLSTAMGSAVANEADKLADRLNILATVGSVAPFVGLFGTVWGIMNTFTSISAQQSTSLVTVGPGIAEALFATAVGLFAAIPAVIAYNRFSHGVNRIEARLSRFADGFHTTLSRQLEAKP